MCAASESQAGSKRGQAGASVIGVQRKLAGSGRTLLLPRAVVCSSNSRILLVPPSDLVQALRIPALR